MARRASRGVAPDESPETAGVTIDLEMPEAGGFTLLEPGEYEAKIVSAAYGLSKADQKPKADFKFEVYTDNGKSTVFTTHSLQPQALFRLRALTDACGLSKEGGTAKAKLNITEPVRAENGQLIGGVLADFIGREVGVIIVHDTYEGKIRNKIDDYFALDAGGDDLPGNPA